MVTAGREYALRNHRDPTRVADFLPRSLARRAPIRVRFLPPLWFDNPTLDPTEVAALRQREAILCRSNVYSQ